MLNSIRFRQKLQFLILKRYSRARFFGLGFFHGSTLYGPQISRLKGFSFLFRFRAIIQIFR
jgi:hypothetical protein